MHITVAAARKAALAMSAFPDVCVSGGGGAVCVFVLVFWREESGSRRVIKVSVKALP